MSISFAMITKRLINRLIEDGGQLRAVPECPSRNVPYSKACSSRLFPHQFLRLHAYWCQNIPGEMAFSISNILKDHSIMVGYSILVD